MKQRDNTFWTPGRDDELALLLQTETLEAIAERFGRTPGGIRWRADFLRLSRGGGAPDQNDEKFSPAAMRQQDENFIAAMYAAIKAGTESAPVGIDRRPCTKAPFYIPHRKQLPRAVSPMASCAEFG